MPSYDLYDLLPADIVIQGRHVPVSEISYDSRKVRPKDVFFCIDGLKFDGHDFAHEAIRAGASAIVVTRQVFGIEDTPQVVVSDARAALSAAASRLYGDPSNKLRIVGVTGTNGKTTTTYLVDSIMRAAGHRTGLIGTVETRIAETIFSAERTTPESLDLQRLFARMVDEGVGSVAMEVSSHAIDLHRVDDVHFEVAAFTNLTQDHLDYHGDMAAYSAVKQRLFTGLDVSNKVINVDDLTGAAFARQLGDAITVGISETADVGAEAIESLAGESRFTLRTQLGRAEIHLPISGRFNVSNALVAAGCGLALGLTLEDIVSGLESVSQVPGRVERVSAGQSFSVFVDYAHTPDSLGKVLETIRKLTSERLIVVFGCGGDRDPTKRPLMGEVAALLADHVIITSDNPRSEDPEAIMAQIKLGARRGSATYQLEVDRRQAIARAFSLACAGDCVLIAGKGHEDYQIFADKTVNFDDRQVALEELKSRC